MINDHKNEIGNMTSCPLLPSWLRHSQIAAEALHIYIYIYIKTFVLVWFGNVRARDIEKNMKCAVCIKQIEKHLKSRFLTKIHQKMQSICLFIRSWYFAMISFKSYNLILTQISTKEWNLLLEMISSDFQQCSTRPSPRKRGWRFAAGLQWSLSAQLDVLDTFVNACAALSSSDRHTFNQIRW